MLTKNEIAADYTLSERGTIASPGKFEGEIWQTVALWDLMLDGGSDFETGDSESGEPVIAWFHVDAALIADLTSNAAERDAFAADYPPGSYLGVWEDSQGFVRLTESAEDPSDDAAEGGSGYSDCACRDCFDVAVSSNVKKPALCSDCSDAKCSDDGRKLNGGIDTPSLCERVMPFFLRRGFGGWDLPMPIEQAHIDRGLVCATCVEKYKKERLLTSAELEEAMKDPLIKAIVEDRIQDVAEGRTSRWTRLAKLGFEIKTKEQGK